MPNPQNIKAHEFKPGQSGNPAGYSRKRRLADELTRLFDEKGLDRAFLLKGITLAMAGDFRYWKEIFDRLDGKVADRLEADLGGGGAMVKVVMPDNGRDRDPAAGGAAMGLPGESG